MMIDISIHALLAESDPEGPAKLPKLIGFLSTLSLRRATYVPVSELRVTSISIHALLAESDACHNGPLPGIYHFYPRSPCGERQGHLQPIGRAPRISIHALLAESDLVVTAFPGSVDRFLSTLSLRRATRKPCAGSGECCISIHALLAESDQRDI